MTLLIPNRLIEQFPAALPAGFSLSDYDRVILYLSAGKDSKACLCVVLMLFDQLNLWGKVELEIWHHEVDGREGSSLMDWPCTPDMSRKIAAHFQIPYYASWLEGGLEREMLRDGTPKAKTWFETPDGLRSAGGDGKPGTRLRFPQASGDLKVRWCSPYAKIDVGRTAICNQPRFLNSRTLTITGDRAQESPKRASYAILEPDEGDTAKAYLARLKRQTGQEFTPEQCDRLIASHRHQLQRQNKNYRILDRWRPVHQWTEQMVWDVLQAFALNPHPSYRLGWGRNSCFKCIFNPDDAWATIAQIGQPGLMAVNDYEHQFGVTIQRPPKGKTGFDPGFTVLERSRKGTPYGPLNPDDIRQALSTEFYEPIVINKWTLPLGAFGQNTGPS